ncbi:hypothetical protein [Winogradskyella sp. SYSU M77433]|uniref:hypothetical protein n=1 Tax=Winogradskyella sp. SYSU M77433 TaxID=3042722 RepID=UPI0024815409|nr:hypothetical protein [Winogradskyella sp. SYSU M77433]MDH7913467.1 hypothetical protein [Winogradskyella sp. SYSU M77433]
MVQITNNTTARKLLFDKGDKDKPLFNSLISMVRLMVKEENGSENYTESEEKTRQNSINTHMSAYLNGNKRLSKKIQKNFMKVLFNRLETDNPRDPKIKEILFAIEAQFQNKNKLLSENYLNSESLRQFHENCQASKRIIFVTAEPVELSQTKIGNRMMDSLSDNLGLVRGKSKNTTKYVYIFHKRNELDTIAVEFWQNLYDLNLEVSDTDPFENIKEINDNDRLSVFSIPHDNLFVLPVTWFDYGLPNQRAYVNFLNDTYLEIFKMPETVFERWHSQIHEVLSSPEEFKKHEIKFNDVIKKKSIKKIDYEFF